MLSSLDGYLKFTDDGKQSTDIMKWTFTSATRSGALVFVMAVVIISAKCSFVT